MHSFSDLSLPACTVSCGCHNWQVSHKTKRHTNTDRWVCRSSPLAERRGFSLPETEERAKAGMRRVKSVTPCRRRKKNKIKNKKKEGKRMDSFPRWMADEVNGNKLMDVYSKVSSTCSVCILVCVFNVMLRAVLDLLGEVAAKSSYSKVLVGECSGRLPWLPWEKGMSDGLIPNSFTLHDGTSHTSTQRSKG